MLPQKELDFACRCFEDLYGFALRWNEKAAFSYYIECCMRDGWEQAAAYAEATALFALNYFGLDQTELSRVCARDRSGRQFMLGMNLLGDESFKEYCRHHADEWRSEIEMI